jgi:hypothetical protein
MIYTTNGTDADRVEVYNGSAWKTLAYTDDVPSVSISLTAPDLFTVTGSPAAYNGTLDFEWNSAAVNSVLAGPSTGSTAAIPTFRSLVDADIPVEIARVDDLPPSGEGGYIAYTEKGEPLGVAELDADGYVPAAQLDLSDYVTLTGQETLTNKTIGDNLKIDGILYFDYSETGGIPTPRASINAFYGMGGTELYITSDGNARLDANQTSGTASIGGYNTVVAAQNNVILDANNGGEYLGSATTANQIATIGDLEALDAYDITATQISNWDDAYDWGDHSQEGYLTTAVESISNTDGNISFSASTGTVTANLATNVEIAGDLKVSGDLDIIGNINSFSTTTINVEDNTFLLNSTVTGTPLVDAGIEVERGTYTNSFLRWDETNNIWVIANTTDTTDAAVPFAIARKAVKTTTGTTHTVTHNLNTSDVTVNCWLDGEQVEASIVVTDANTVTVTTNTSITNLKTVVVG